MWIGVLMCRSFRDVETSRVERWLQIVFIFYHPYFNLPPDEAKSIKPNKLTSFFNIKLMAILRRRARQDDPSLIIVMAGDTGMFHPRYLDASPTHRPRPMAPESNVSWTSSQE